MTITEEFRLFRPGTRARALFYLKTGILDVTANQEMQRTLDRWVQRIERHGPRAREKVLAKLEGALEPPV